MSILDWVLVFGINGAIIAYGSVKARGTVSTVDWFLAAKGLPWWIVGLSMFATAVDSGDYVAVAGGAYDYGISFLSQWWLGFTVAWLLAAYFVFLPMYRTGVYTNAEYLEYRFGPTARLLSVLVQIQYRTNVLGNIAYSLYLTVWVLTDWTSSVIWSLVVFVALGAAIYTASGGLRAVALTDALQSVTILVASFVLWWLVWNAVGGWSGLEEKLKAIEPDLADSMLHVGGYHEPAVPSGLVVLGWVIVISSYCMVNHSQTMRMLASRSQWDMRMAPVVAIVVTTLVAWCNITLGVLGRSVFPELGATTGSTVDEIFPRLMKEYLGAGLLGVVVAGIVAGAISTYDSIGSSLSALFTRDIYARFLVKDRADSHYLTVSRVVTFFVIGISFAYIPFLQEGMVKFYMGIIRVTVIPLFTVYMMGTLTRVNRQSGSVGLAVGILYGLSSFLGDQFQWHLPIYWTSVWWSYVWGILLTALAMVVTSAVGGWCTREELGDLVYSTRAEREPPDKILPILTSKHAETSWLEKTRREIPIAPLYPFPLPASGLPWYKKPSLWAWLLVAIAILGNLVIFW